jgi:hypothetical protein
MVITVTTAHMMRLRQTTGVFIRISHTMRSWGMDMESLLTDHLRVFLGEKKPALPRYMDYFSTMMGFVTSAAVASVLLMCGVQILRHVTLGYAVSDAPSKATWDDLLRANSHKIDLLYSFLGGGNAVTLTTLSFIYLIAAIILSITAGVLIGTGASQDYPSFIIFTPRDEKHKNAELQKYNSRWQRTACGFLLSVGGGVLANIVTVLLW